MENTSENLDTRDTSTTSSDRFLMGLQNLVRREPLGLAENASFLLGASWTAEMIYHAFKDGIGSEQALAHGVSATMAFGASIVLKEIYKRRSNKT